MKILKPCDTKEAEKYLNTKVLYADEEDDFCIVYENHDRIYHKMIKVE